MAISASTREGRQRILEGLWLIGIEPGQLAVDPGIDGSEFLAQLNRNGVHSEFIRRASAGVEWRASSAPRGTLTTKVMDLLRVSGYREDEIRRFMDEAKGKDERGVMDVLARQFNERTAGAMIFKATGGRPPEGAVWNPFRTDTPPQNANLKFGAGGMAAGVLPPGWTATERPTPIVSTVPGQKAPTASQRSGVPPKPGTTMAGRPGPGAGGPGASPPSGIDDPFGTGAGTGAGYGTPAPVDDRPLWVKQGRDPTPEEFDQYVHENFGAQAWFMDVPEVRQVIWDMAKGGLTDGAEAQRRVSRTQWFKNTSAAARTWHAHERADPATAQQDIAEQTQTFITMANKMGLEIPQDRIRTLAEASMRFGWNVDQINKALAKEFRYNPNNKNQNAKVSEMKALASKYLVPLADQTIDTWARGLLSGEFSDEQFSEYLKGTAKSMFPQLAQAIDTGITVEDYINPYKQLAAQRLELPPESINFMDTKWRAALQVPDTKTGQPRVMTLTEWESHIKTDAAYGYDKTQQGVSEAAKLAEEIAKKFGQVA